MEIPLLKTSKTGPILGVLPNSDETSKTVKNRKVFEIGFFGIDCEKRRLFAGF